MIVVENVDRCIYKIQVSDVGQDIIEELANLYGVEIEFVVSMMFCFAENMAVSKIINVINARD